MNYEPLIDGHYFHIYNCGNNKEDIFIEDAKTINKSYNRTGSLFKDRFSRIKITDESYLKSLLIYIHTNPTHHQFVDDFKEYKYSSYKSFISKRPTLLNRDFVLNLFENRENFQFVHNNKQLKIKEELLLE